MKDSNESKPLNSATGDSNQQVTVHTERKPSKLEIIVSCAVLVTCGFLIAGIVNNWLDRNLTLNQANDYSDKLLEQYKRYVDDQIINTEVRLSAQVKAQDIVIDKVLDDVKSDVRLNTNQVNYYRREMIERGYLLVDEQNKESWNGSRR